ncbi:N-acetylglucosamine kinase of eukaryotic type [Geitlerinema sp. FC II]|nr:N-acetylglucosamine kinase of eukaryotic type [Geitlerinema sp. FC II]
MNIVILRAMQAVLGVDGGGTKTVCLLTDTTGKILGRGEAGASNYQSVGGEAAYRSLLNAIREAIAGQEVTVRGIALGLAGIGRPEDEAIVRDWVELLQDDDRLSLQWSLPPKGVCVCHDCAIALAGGLGREVGVATIAGTGSIVYGRNRLGHTARSGGWGYLLGDEGSGYDIARQGLQAIARAFDGRSQPTALSDAFRSHLGLQDLRDLVERVYRRGWTAKDIAALAPVVDKVASQGDRVAEAIVDRAASELALATKTVAGQLFDPLEPFEIVTVGGLWHGTSTLRQQFAQQVTTELPASAVVWPRHEPAYGAALTVLRVLGKR